MRQTITESADTALLELWVQRRKLANRDAAIDRDLAALNAGLEKDSMIPNKYSVAEVL